MEIKVKYLNDDLIKMNKIVIGDWIDLRAAKDISLKQFESANIPLGVAMEIPNGYEAIVAPRSSTFKNFGIIMANSIGIIDNSYCGDNDEWNFVALALIDTTIKFNDRIAQFRIVKNMPNLDIKEVNHLGNFNRGGIGSTGIN